MKRLSKTQIICAIALLPIMILSGCNTTTALNNAENNVKGSEPLTLLEGDVIRIEFPGAPSLNSDQTIRRDGKITLAMVGEVTAAGLTPSGLEESLRAEYGSQLNSKEVSVTVVSSSFPIFVAGAVQAPGRIQSDRSITALEAIMEAGGFDPATANLKKVVVTRLENGVYRHYSLDLQSVLEGQHSDPFYLKPSDIVTVPTKVVFF